MLKRRNFFQAMLAATALVGLGEFTHKVLAKISNQYSSSKTIVKSNKEILVSMTLPMGSRWRLPNNHVIEITSTRDTTFTGKYVDINNPSKFFGEIQSRQAEVIHIKQQHDEANYFAFYTGLKKGQGYEGTYYDNAGNTGVFNFTKV